MTKAKIANPRWLWITALVVGGACTIGFAMILIAPAETSTPGPTPASGSPAGFGIGVLVGLAAGIAIGIAIARQLRSPK